MIQGAQPGAQDVFRLFARREQVPPGGKRSAIKR